MEEMEKTPLNVNDVVQARISAARMQIVDEDEKGREYVWTWVTAEVNHAGQSAGMWQRETRQEARRRGLAQRHAQKLRNLAADRPPDNWANATRPNKSAPNQEGAA